MNPSRNGRWYDAGCGRWDLPDEARTVRDRRQEQGPRGDIASLRLAILENFWQEDDPFPASKEPRWWEVWFARLPGEPDPSEQIRDVCRELNLRLDEHTLAFVDRVVALVYGDTEQLGQLLTTNTVVAELHQPRRISELLDVDGETDQGLVEDLQGRLESARPESPAACLLDTGVADAPTPQAIR